MPQNHIHVWSLRWSSSFSNIVFLHQNGDVRARNPNAAWHKTKAWHLGCIFDNNWDVWGIVWPQWWTFADVSQQGIDFTKKISKKIIFWFDFHKCSHRPSKIRRHFRNKSRSILKLSKNVFYKKCGPKLIFFNETFF